jgi:putative transposase
MDSENGRPKASNLGTSVGSSTRKGRSRRGEQLALPRTSGWGGKRRGAGRKRSDADMPGSRSRVVHAPRPIHKGRHPVHVTLRAKPGLPSFRQQRVQRLVAEVLRDQRRRRYRNEFRIVHYTIQRNHLHLVVEADTERAKGYKPLRSGVSGFEIAFARRLNLRLRRRGKVWADRYHRHDLKTPRETWSGLAYVFGNYTHHGMKSHGAGVLDIYASGCVFDGWEGDHFIPADFERWRWPVCRAQTWLARKGYLVHGRLPITLVS